MVHKHCILVINVLFHITFIMCCWFKCEHGYATISNVNMALTIEPNCEFLCKKVKLLSHDENYSKFNIFLTLGLKVMKSPSRNFTRQKLSKNIMNFLEIFLKLNYLILMNFIQHSIPLAPKV